MSMQTLTWDVDAAAVAGNNDAYIVSHLLYAGETWNYSKEWGLRGQRHDNPPPPPNGQSSELAEVMS